MPHYEFFCHACKKTFSRSWLLLTMRKVELPAHTASATTWSNAALPSPSLLRRKAPDRNFEARGG
jgi:hypothetical protein